MMMPPHYSHSQLSALRTAMSSASMLEILRRAWPSLSQAGRVLKDCQAARVHPRENNQFVIEYQLRLADEKTETVQRVFGELVGDVAEQYHAELLERLKNSRNDLHRRGLLAERVALVPQLGMVLRFSELDDKLEGLKLVLHREKMRAIVTPYLSLNGAELKKCTPEIIGHRLGKRCVIRCHVQWMDRERGRKRKHSLIGKLYKPENNRGQQIFETMRDLYDQGFRDGAQDGIRIPKPLAIVPDYDLLLMEDVPGTSLELLDKPGFEAGVSAAGRALAKLHRVRLNMAKRFGPADEVAIIQGWVAVAAQVSPALKNELEQTLAEVQCLLGQCDRFEPTLVHRDFYDKQIMINGTETIVMDFDTLCLSDPAIDFGNFLAHVHLAGLKRLGNVEALEQAFVAAYRPAPSAELLSRTQTYKRSSLLRLACIHALWPQWSHLAEPLLREVA